MAGSGRSTRLPSEYFSYHSITWSARCRSDGGIGRLRAFAGLRLMTNSYRFLDGQVPGLGENLVHIRWAPARDGSEIRPVRDEALSRADR